MPALASAGLSRHRQLSILCAFLGDAAVVTNCAHYCACGLYRDVQAEVELDGALAQMGASFLDVASPTQADEELYAAASHAHSHRQTFASGALLHQSQQVLPLFF